MGRGKKALLNGKYKLVLDKVVEKQPKSAMRNEQCKIM